MGWLHDWLTRKQPEPQTLGVVLAVEQKEDVVAPVTPEKPPRVIIIGEPVVSLVNSLRGLEDWDMEHDYSLYSHTVVYKHREHLHLTVRFCFSHYPRIEPSRWECSETWMTKDEQEYMVGVHIEVMAARALVALEQRRDAFNVLINEK